MKEAVALETQPKANPASRLPKNPPHLWKPGQSGNPAGRPKRLSELHAVAQANFGLANTRLSQLINSENEETAKWAVGFTFAYILGKPPEGRDLLHWETLRARLTELVAVPAEAEEAREALAVLPLAAEQTPSPVPLPTSEPRQASPEAPRVVTPSREPSGLHCLYRAKDGHQCQESPVAGASWCGPHKAKLFDMVSE